MRITAKQSIWLLILGYFVVFGVMTALRHYNFQTQAWDLAAFVQTFWNTAQGRIMENNLEQVHNHLGLHMSPWLLVLAPGYALFQTPYYLLFIQTLALALGAWPLYLLAQKVLGRKWLSFVIVFSYLLYPSLHWANFYDFHEITFFVPLFLAAFYFVESKRWGWAGLFFALAASVKEDAILAVFFAGIYFLFLETNPKSEALNSKQDQNSNLQNFKLLNLFRISNLGFRVLRNKKKAFGIIIAVLALFYFLLAVKVFMPALGGGVLRFDRYANFGATPAAAIATAVTHPALVAQTIFTPEKLFYLLILLFPVAFLPIFSPKTWILFLPGLPENLLTNYNFQFSGLYHYDSILIPAVLIGSVYGLKNLIDRWPSASAREGGWRRERLFFWVILIVAALGFLTRSPLSPKNFPISYFQDTPQKLAYRSMVTLVPDGISVAANTNMVPHLAHREYVYALGSEPKFMDMVLIDLGDSFGFKDEGAFQTYIDNYIQSGFFDANLFENRYLVITSKKLKLVPKP
ncbi:MAG: DUF2079 domain-containing protein [bacterium]|nr:DUF2079 domain-containing protein [bacterium]